MRFRVLRFWLVAVGLLIVAGAAIGVATPGVAADAKSFVGTPGEAERAISQIIEAAGRVPQVLNITIKPQRVSITAQGKDRGWRLEAWSFAVRKLWFLTRESVDGPEPVQASGPVDDVVSGLFQLTDIRLADAPALAWTAIKRAGLEDEAHIVSMSIARTVSILPKPTYGEIRWTIEVASANEQATVYADAKSHIIGADLSGTHRAKTLNYYTGDWLPDQARLELGAIIGHAETVYQFGVAHDGLYVDVVSPDDPDKLRRYSWDLGGVRRGIVDVPNIDRIMPIAGRRPFSFDVVDLGLIKPLARAARQRLGMPEGEVSDMTATHPAVGVSSVVLVWEVEVTDTDGSKGKVKADEKGNITTVALPRNRLPKRDLLSPEAIEDTLQRLAQSFGPKTRFIDITFFNDQDAVVVAEDPLKPGTKAKFTVSPTDMERFGTGFFTAMRPEDTFTLEEARSIDVKLLKAMEDETVKRIRLQGSALSLVDFSRGNAFVRSPRGMITVEMRVATPQAVQSGRVTFEADGHVLDVMQP